MGVTEYSFHGLLILIITSSFLAGFGSGKCTFLWTLVESITYDFKALRKCCPEDADPLKFSLRPEFSIYLWVLMRILRSLKRGRVKPVFIWDHIATVFRWRHLRALSIQIMKYTFNLHWNTLLNVGTIFHQISTLKSQLFLKIQQLLLLTICTG